MLVNEKEEEEEEEEEERRWRNRNFTATYYSTPAYSQVRLRVFLWTARQYHSVCMFGLGGSSFFGRFPAGASVWYFEISLAIPK